MGTEGEERFQQALFTWLVESPGVLQGRNKRKKALSLSLQREKNCCDCDITFWNLEPSWRRGVWVEHSDGLCFFKKICKFLIKKISNHEVEFVLKCSE